MVLHRQILFSLAIAAIAVSLAIAAIAEAILMRTFAEQVPSSHRVAPTHSKPVTSCNFWPFVLTSSLGITEGEIAAFEHQISRLEIKFSFQIQFS